MKLEVGFENDLEDVMGAPSRFFKFCTFTRGLFEELVRHAKGGGSQECPTCEACKESIEHVLLKQVLSLNTLEAFPRRSIKTAFCSEEKGFLVNKSGPLYNRVGNFLLSIWDRRKRKFIQQWTSMHGPTTQPHSSRVRIQWH